MRALLDAAGVEYAIDPTLVRGLDYYTRTIFSFVCDRLGAQSEIGGGGRYDGLIEQLGGPPTPAVGWAAGVERILLALGESAAEAAPSATSSSPRRRRRRGRAAGAGPCRRAASRRAARPSSTLPAAALKGQIKQADRIGAGRVVVVEEDGIVQLRDMESGEQRRGRERDLVAEIEGEA